MVLVKSIEDRCRCLCPIQVHLSDQQFYCLFMCDLYCRFCDIYHRLPVVSNRNLNSARTPVYRGHNIVVTMMNHATQLNPTGWRITLLHLFITLGSDEIKLGYFVSSAFIKNMVPYDNKELYWNLFCFVSSRVNMHITTDFEKTNVFKLDPSPKRNIEYMKLFFQLTYLPTSFGVI